MAAAADFYMPSAIPYISAYSDPSLAANSWFNDFRTNVIAKVPDVKELYVGEFGYPTSGPSWATVANANIFLSQTKCGKVGTNLAGVWLFEAFDEPTFVCSIRSYCTLKLFTACYCETVMDSSLRMMPAKI